MTEFLPGVPAQLVLNSLARSPGNEIASGKFDSPESSAALAVNAFGWFLERPRLMPPLPNVPMGRPEEIEVEAEMHFPWRGGRHPWLDAAITTPTTLVGVESKRYEPFRPGKTTVFSEQFDSRDWGDGLGRFTALRRALTSGKASFRHLDAAQLVKHAYGLHTQARKRGRGAVLAYVYAAPEAWANGKPVSPTAIAAHEAEVLRFATAVRGDAVVFAPVRWADLIRQWAGDQALAAHAQNLLARFGRL